MSRVLRQMSVVAGALSLVVAAAGCVPPTPADPCPASSAPAGAVWFRGTSGPDVFRLDYQPDRLNVAFCLLGGDDRVELGQHPGGAVYTSVVVLGGSGADTVEAIGDPTAPNPTPWFRAEHGVFRMGSGDDLLIPDEVRTAEIDMGDGNDRVSLGSRFRSGWVDGPYVVRLGRGDDRLSSPVLDQVTYAGPGNDLVSLTLDGLPAPSQGLRRPIEVFGEDGADQLIGSIYGDGLYGGPGDDQISTGITTSAGDPDIAQGGTGNDVLRGGAGYHLLAGEEGDDDIRSEDSDTAFPAEEDTLDGGGGVDGCLSVSGLDTIVQCET